MFSTSRISLLLCLLLIAVGCQKGSDSGSEDQSSASSASAEADSQAAAVPEADTAGKPSEKKEGDEKPKLEMPKLPETVDGNWVLTLPERQQLMPLYLFKITSPEKSKAADQKGESQEVKLLDKSPNIAPAKIVSAKTTKETVEFDESLLDEEGKQEYVRLNFKGKLNKERGMIYGNISFNNENCTPALLIHTRDQDFSKINPLPSPGAQEMIQAMQTNDPFQPLNEFTQKMKTAPLALDAYPTLLAVGLSLKKDKETIEDIVQRYSETAALWGKRMQANAMVGAASMLARTDDDSALATKYLDEVNQLIKDGVKPLNSWDREMALAKARVGLKSGDPEKIKAAGKLLESEVKKHPHDRQLLTELVEYEKTHGSIDKAIEHLGILAGSPLSNREQRLIAVARQNPGAVKFEDPRDTLTELWKKKHGSTKGLDEYLTESFKRYLSSFVSKEAKEVDLKKGNRTSLIELFTGASCPPCVAADLATGVIESSFPPSKVIVLRYHQHIPAPDPLTNSDSEARLFFYKLNSTPSTILNGQQVFGAAGGIERVESSYSALLEALIPELSKNTDVKIDLTAVAKDGNLELKANATGTDKIKEPLRLVTVLAEDELHFEAPNGINLHDMIVRSMLSEPNGFPAVDGKLSMEKTLPLNDFKGRISDYLSAFEEKSGANFTGAPLALEKLHFVVFVQGELSKEIFQVASVPVSGTITYKSEAAPETPKPEKKETKPAVKEKKPAEKPAKADAKPKAEAKPKADAKPEAAKPEGDKPAEKKEAEKAEK